jgi:hypothetical protein
MAVQTRATACCTMSGQTDDPGPIEVRVAVGPVKMARHAAPSATLVLPVFAPAFDAPAVVHTVSCVPLYLRQVSLLI